MYQIKFIQCAESYKSHSIKMNMVYSHLGAKDLLWNSFLLHQYTTP